VILKQYYLGCLAHASYLVADEESRVAAIVDPKRDVDEYLADAEALGLRIEHVLLTHFHADFVAGHLELRERTGATIHYGARGEAEYPAERLGDHDVVELGPDVRLEVLETPGHSPESISIVVRDRAHGELPYAVLTGDTLFVGDVGRPDLRAALGWTAEELGSMLYDSLREQLLPLPDETLVYPGHGPGSLCGKAISAETVSTIGQQRLFNYALKPMSRDEFIRIVTADQPDSPAYFTYDAILNTKERPTLDSALERELVPLTLDEVLAAVADGAQLLDTRAAVDVDAAHLRGAIAIGLDGSFATWAGTLLDPGRPIVVVADPGREGEAAMRLGRIGFDNVSGHLAGGMQSAASRTDLMEAFPRVTGAQLSDELRSDDPPVVLDVRSPTERATGAIEGSVHIPLNRLPAQLEALPRDREIVCSCGSGYRSPTAATVLARAGFTNLTDLVGGMDAWRASDLPVVADATVAS
jgi:glyoxylase-like metal-dependent hydrolase (beta-lactamase superfamily II)